LYDLNLLVMMSKHWGKFLGGLLGLIFAILVIALGFWWAIFVFLCISIGIFIGWRFDLGNGLHNLLEQLFAKRKDE